MARLFARSIATRKLSIWDRIPIISHFRKSVGVQRGMLVFGLVLTAIFLLTAAFAPLIAPYSFNTLRDENGLFGAQNPPSAEHIWGTTVGGYDVFSRVVWGAQTAFAVIVVAVLLSIFAGILLGLVSGYFGGWLDRVLVAAGALGEVAEDLLPIFACGASPRASWVAGPCCLRRAASSSR